MREVNSKGGVWHTTYGGRVLIGARPPLVLIHGAGGSHLHWPPEIRRMRGELVYGLDLPGHGQSASDVRDCIGEYARDLVQWMDSLEERSAVFVGHSMGGAIALELALEAADRVAGLVLVGTGARLRVHPQILTLTENDASYVQALELISTWSFSPQADARLVELAGMRMGEVDRRVIRMDLLACDRFDVMDRLGEIDVPTLILCGSDDLMTPAKYSNFLAQHIPSARLEFIRDAGHMVMLEKPEEVAGLIADFMMKHFNGER
jgi:pimeloyl-ACP methyl ester carboxylesterase